MERIETPLVQVTDGRFFGAVKIYNGKGAFIQFDVCAKEKEDAERLILSEILEIKDGLMDAFANFEATTSIKRESAHGHIRRKREKYWSEAEKITRLYAAKKGETECKHIGDIDGFIPNIAVAKVVMLNGYGSFRIISFDTTIDIEQGFIIQNVIMTEE